MSLPILLFGIPITKQALRAMLQSATTKIRQKTNTTFSMIQFIETKCFEISN